MACSTRAADQESDQARGDGGANDGSGRETATVQLFGVQLFLHHALLQNDELSAVSHQQGAAR